MTDRDRHLAAGGRTAAGATEMGSAWRKEDERKCEWLVVVVDDVTRPLVTEDGDRRPTRIDLYSRKPYVILRMRESGVTYRQSPSPTSRFDSGASR